MPTYQPHIPDSFGDLLDKMTYMLLCSPTFADESGYFRGRDVEKSFYGLNEGLRRLRPRLGEDLFRQLMTMSDQMRAHFEADPAEETGEARKGKDLVYVMEELIKARWAEVRAASGRTRSRAGSNGK